jgi:hypothetical protein
MEGLPAGAAFLSFSADPWRDLPLPSGRFGTVKPRSAGFAAKIGGRRPSGLDIARHFLKIAGQRKGLEMQKWIGFAAVVAATLGLLCQSADAGSRRHQDDKRLAAVGFGVGLGATVGYFALRDWSLGHPRNPAVGSGAAATITTVGCMAASPIVATLVIQRPLTMREGHVMMADCLIPFIGGWLVNKAYDNHPEWEGKRRHKH